MKISNILLSFTAIVVAALNLSGCGFSPTPPPQPSISVTVTDETGSPIEGAEVTMAITTPGIRSLTSTDSQGVARISFEEEYIPAAATLTISASGYESHTQEIQLQANIPPQQIRLTLN